MKNKVNRISDVRELYVRCTRVSSFFSSKLIESCTKLECISVVLDYAEFTNLTIFGPKVVQPKTLKILWDFSKIAVFRT